MKKKQTRLIGFIAVTLALAFAGCKAPVRELRLTGTDSFNFTETDDGTGYIVGAGTATEGTVNIPAYYRPDENSEYLPVRFISPLAFWGRTGITSVTIPATVWFIGDEAFRYCTGLSSVTIGEGLTSIGSRAFLDCAGLTSITIPANVTYIGDYAFYDCTNLTSVTLAGNALTYVGRAAFPEGIDGNYNTFWSNYGGAGTYIRDVTNIYESSWTQKK